MLFPPKAVERAMQIKEVMLRAMNKEYSWLQAAEILGITPRGLRRLRQRMDQFGYQGLVDMRHGRPSPRRTPVPEVERILELYRERYPGFNGRHFWQLVRRDHAVRLSYSCVKQILQGAGLLKKKRARGPIAGDGNAKWSQRTDESHPTGSAGQRTPGGRRGMVSQANAYLREHYVSRHSEFLAREPQNPQSAFAAVSEVVLDDILCVELVRTVGKDNVVTMEGIALQIVRQPGRATCAGLHVVVRRHLDGGYSVRRGVQIFGRYHSNGRPVEAAGPVENRERTRFPPRTLDAGKRSRRPQLPQALAPAKL